VPSWSTEDKWRLVKSAPDMWWDNRENKTNLRAPDYKLKDKSVNVALWLSSKDTPEWAREELS